MGIEIKYEELTKKIIGVFYEVYNVLGPGFLEKVYENAMRVEFERLGVEVKCQCPIKVDYKGIIVGDYIADFLVENKVVVEIKAKSELSSFDNAQLLNYLKGTEKDVGLLFNFGKRAEFERKIFESVRSRNF
jgi:GxxExxY protein